MDSDQAREQMMDWISVTDQLPEKNQRVLAWYEGYEQHSDTTWHRESIEFAVFWYPGCEHSTDGWSKELIRRAKDRIGADHLEITHWMALPERPPPHDDTQ